MTKVANNLLSYFLSLNILLISLSISGCTLNNPAHSPSITGDIEISKDSKGDLCFIPIFSSATFMKEFVDIENINMEYLTISEPNSKGGGRIKINIEPSSNKYFILKKLTKITLDEDLSFKLVKPKLSDLELIATNISALDYRVF